MYCMAPTRYDLRTWGRLIKTIFKNFPDIYTHVGTNLHYIPIVISKSAHPNDYRPELRNPSLHVAHTWRDPTALSEKYFEICHCPKSSLISTVK
jgi:hypothetical protein